jgi:predicted PurR-regulated permease PerM
LGVLVLVLGLAYFVFRPFLLTCTLAAAVALFLAPAQRRLSRILLGRPAVAAGLLVLLTTAVILVPVLSSVALLANQGVAFFAWVGPQLQPDALQRLWGENIAPRLPWLQPWLRRGDLQLAPLVSDALSQVAAGARDVIQGIVTGLTTAVLELVLFLLMLFFLLKDGAALRAYFRAVSPLTEAQENAIADHLAKTVKGVLQAMVVVPLVQGFLAALAFWVLGVPSPVLWGVAVVFAALVPILGSPLGWVPAAVYLFVTAGTARGLAMLIYGAVVISGIDNVIKPLLLRGTAQIHPLLGFLSILGGVLAFGPLGFLVGPVILSLALSALRLYRLDVLRAPPVPARSGATEAQASGERTLSL